ncbi:MAG: chromate transporter [Clostridiales bacterium]|nr:chromate transporter [Clostridiales bacterium]
MLPVIFQTVSNHGLLTDAEFDRMVALSQALPGPVSINAVSYAGYVVASVPGAIVSVFAIVCPAFILVLLVMKFLDRFRDSESVNSVITGIRPITMGLICTAAVMISENTLYLGSLVSAEWAIQGLSYLNPIPCIIFPVVFVLTIKSKINPFFLIISAAVFGAFFIR